MRQNFRRLTRVYPHLMARIRVAVFPPASLSVRCAVAWRMALHFQRLCKKSLDIEQRLNETTSAGSTRCLHSSSHLVGYWVQFQSRRVKSPRKWLFYWLVTDPVTADSKTYLSRRR
jgi:hypothetical protein